jgi:hypothetical protein
LTIVLRQAGDDFALSVQINYQETRASRAFMLLTRQFRSRLFEVGILKAWEDVPIPRPAIAISLIALIAAAAILYLTLKSGPDERIARLEPSPPSVETGTIPSPSPDTSAIREHTPPPPGKPKLPVREQPSKPESITREQIERQVRSLLDVRRVYVESFGEDSFSQSVRQKLIETLQTGNDFVITNSPDTADTAISGSARFLERRPEGNGQAFEIGDVELKMLNASGEVIWRTKRYRGTASFVANKFARDLLEATASEKRRQKED